MTQKELLEIKAAIAKKRYKTNTYKSYRECFEAGISAILEELYDTDTEQIKQELVTYFGDHAQAEMAYSICFKRNGQYKWIGTQLNKDGSYTDRFEKVQPEARKKPDDLEWDVYE
jgi:hypothetical protein